jgi:uncharacterized protein YecE (DUF72 family)
LRIYLVIGKFVEVYVGTSGWVYDWNAGGSLNWYLRNSGLNAVELNASFYRFPFPAQVAKWGRMMRDRSIRWSVKVHRSITHLRKLGAGSLPTWGKFRKLFEPLEDYIDFYLIQLPPMFKADEGNVERLREFARFTQLGGKLAVEFRDRSWFSQDTVELCRSLGVTAVSVDSPIGSWVVSSNGIVYLRLHGRVEWYAYEYSEEELKGLARAVADLNPGKVYVFFNNDHWMLENARAMLRLLTSMT